MPSLKIYRTNYGTRQNTAMENRPLETASLSQRWCHLLHYRPPERAQPPTTAVIPCSHTLCLVILTAAFFMNCHSERSEESPHFAFAFAHAAPTPPACHPERSLPQPHRGRRSRRTPTLSRQTTTARPVLQIISSLCLCFCLCVCLCLCLCLCLCPFPHPRNPVNPPPRPKIHQPPQTKTLPPQKYPQKVGIVVSLHLVK